MTDSFWVGGQRANEVGIREHYDELLDELRDRLADTIDETPRNECESEIKRLERECRGKLDENGGLLY